MRNVERKALPMTKEKLEQFLDQEYGGYLDRRSSFKGAKTRKSFGDQWKRCYQISRKGNRVYLEETWASSNTIALSDFSRKRLEGQQRTESQPRRPERDRSEEIPSSVSIEEWHYEEMRERQMRELQQGDRIRYELERRAARDPNFQWPSQVPRRDAFGPIESQRLSFDRTYGPSTHSPYEGIDDQTFREDFVDPYFPGGDHA